MKRKYLIIQRCGDRDKENYSVSEVAYTIAANPMSDRIQMLIIIDE